MSTEILVNAMPYETRVAIIEHGLVQELYIELFRVMTLTPIIFAASMVLGEVLIADRRARRAAPQSATLPYPAARATLDALIGRSTAGGSNTAT